MSDKKETVEIDLDTLRILLHSGRALYSHILRSENPGMDTALMLNALNGAIDKGHELLGTDRNSADQWVTVMGGITQAQLHNMKKLLDSEQDFRFIPGSEDVTPVNFKDKE